MSTYAPQRSPEYPPFHGGLPKSADWLAGDVPDLTSDELISQVATPIEQPTIRMIIPEFDLELRVPVFDSSVDIEKGTATIKAQLIKGLHIVLGFRRNSEKLDTMLLDSLDFEKTAETAGVDYVASTIWAMVGLSKHVSVELEGLGKTASRYRIGFPADADTIAQMMSRRQLAFWILAVESAIGMQFTLPPSVTGDEIEVMSYLYQAVTVGVFSFPADSITVELPSTPDSDTLLESTRTETRFTFGPTSKTKTVFGAVVPIGIERVFINGPVENYEEAKENIDKDGVSVVPLIVRPYDGLCVYEIDNAPGFRPELFDPIVSKLHACTPSLVQKYSRRLESLQTAELEVLLQLNRNEVVATYTVSLRYSNMQQLEKAIGLLRWHVRFPSDATYFGSPKFYVDEICLLSKALLDYGDPVTAERHLRRALLADRFSVQARTSLGASLLLQGKLLEAEAELKEALRLDPNYSDAHCLLDQTLDRILSDMSRHAENATEGLHSLDLKDDELDDLIDQVRRERFEKVYSSDRK